MKHLLIFLFALCTSFPLLSQEDEEEQTYQEEEELPAAPVSGREVGVDLNLSASTIGGSGGLGLKFGFVRNEQFVFGPSIRYQHSWSNFNGIKTGFSVYGAGGFFHVRLYEYLFAGAEIELLSSPIQNGYISANRTWVPVALVGGGFSHAFGPNFRLNAGIMYDVVNSNNSPLRQGYFMRNKQGILLPVLYRIAFFFPL